MLLLLARLVQVVLAVLLYNASGQVTVPTILGSMGLTFLVSEVLPVNCEWMQGSGSDPVHSGTQLSGCAAHSAHGLAGGAAVGAGSMTQVAVKEHAEAGMRQRSRCWKAR